MHQETRFLFPRAISLKVIEKHDLWGEIESDLNDMWHHNRQRVSSDTIIKYFSR